MEEIIYCSVCKFNKMDHYHELSNGDLRACCGNCCDHISKHNRSSAESLDWKDVIDEFGKEPEKEGEYMNFGEAIESMKDNKLVSRAGWNGKGMYLYITIQELNYPPCQNNEEWKSGVFDGSTFIVMRTADAKLIPWLASQTDILAEDWEIYNP